MRKLVAGSVVLLMVACSGSVPQPAPPASLPQSEGSVPPGSAPSEPPPPWAGDGLSWSAVPPPYRAAWEAAENRATCAPLAPAAAIAPAGTPRTATFMGGWAVAYDTPETRSAYGVAGTGASADGTTYDGFPYTMRWSDGSLARYGPEGGSGPNQLAYLTIPGQTCLYNIWSRVGVAHLEELLRSLRFVRIPE